MVLWVFAFCSFFFGGGLCFLEIFPSRTSAKFKLPSVSGIYTLEIQKAPVYTAYSLLHQ